MKPFQPPKAPVTRALVIACIAIHALVTLVPGLEDEAALRGALIPARLAHGVPLAGAAPAWLTPLTSAFLHAGWLHLAFNMLFLGYIGRFVEWLTGPLRFLILYLAGGYAGGLLQVAVDPESIVPVVGASGAISAVFAAYAVLFARQQVQGRRVAGISIPPAVVASVWYAAVWIGIQLLTGAVLGWQGIAIWSHIGGFVAGLILVRPLSRNARVEPLG
ncbi:MAG: rhomboid family intramembrane serine protease [Alphaproteobacteria bacterium]|nr:rhomboid family intramembrane serine protease [Alphaproteobacteria bacterium]